ncbi:ferric reductase-like transmembrane domain-containing protein [Streptomyces coerulescens]|uniref:Ferric reductase-like transmembrane domain-containing protein n=1 Tax=Streptomyces coerulescens TaxID=29304 RepID=A0ABW0CWK3_STRCD
MANSCQVRRGTVLPDVVAQRALWTFVTVNVVIVEVLFLTAGAGKNGTLTAAKFFGLHTALLMLFQLLLVARLPWLDRRIGMDRLTGWHRWVGFTLVWTLLTHGTLVVLGYARLDDASMLKTLIALSGVPASLLGILAAVLVIVVAVVSTRSLRRRLRYETWHGGHLTLYLAIGLSFVHQLLETTTFTASGFARIYWWALWLFTFGAFVAGRVVVPVWRNVHHRFQVAAVVPESGNVVSIHVTGRHLDRLPARAGQFAIWRFPGHHHWWPANPFSLSAAPNGQSLRLTVRAAGSTSAGLRHLPVGTRVFMEGPYGAFTSLQRTRPDALLIAGGVGITPIRALLEEEATGDVVVLYRVRSAHDAVLIDEVRDLIAARGGRLHLLTGRTSAGTRPFEPDNLQALVPDITERDVYVCGPPAMTSAVLGGLRELNVPQRQVHAEKFSLA